MCNHVMLMLKDFEEEADIFKNTGAKMCIPKIG